MMQGVTIPNVTFKQTNNYVISLLFVKYLGVKLLDHIVPEPFKCLRPYAVVSHCTGVAAFRLLFPKCLGLHSVVNPLYFRTHDQERPDSVQVIG